MWNTFVYNNETFLIKIVMAMPHKICLSNMVNFWTEELSNTEIVEKCKNFNPFLTTDDDTYVSHVLNLINNINNNIIVVNKVDDCINLECKTKIDSIIFKFNFSLKLSSNVSFCEELIVPLIQSIQYLENRQSQLCDLLVKKDEEIEQHVFEHGSIKRESVITEKFDQSQFIQNTATNLLCNLFRTTDDFHKSLIEKYGCPVPELLTVKVKEEEGTKKKSSKTRLVKKIIKHRNVKLNTLKVQKEDY